MLKRGRNADAAALLVRYVEFWLNRAGDSAEASLRMAYAAELLGACVAKSDPDRAEELRANIRGVAAKNPYSVELKALANFSREDSGGDPRVALATAAYVLSEGPAVRDPGPVWLTTAGVYLDAATSKTTFAGSEPAGAIERNSLFRRARGAVAKASVSFDAGTAVYNSARVDHASSATTARAHEGSRECPRLDGDPTATRAAAYNLSQLYRASLNPAEARSVLKEHLTY
jgi:hypothetical protein